MNTRLKQIRNFLKLNQQEMADNFNVQLVTYRNYEQGKRGLPLELIEKLNEKLNININWLFTGTGEIFINTSCNTLIKTDNSKKNEQLEFFYKRFNELLLKNKLDDTKIAKIIDTTESRIEKLTTGTAMPTFEELQGIKSNFDVSIDWLLYGELSNI